MIKYKNNQTLKFILPLVTEVPAELLINKDFIGAFVGDIERPQWDGNLILSYYYPYTIEFAKLDAKLCRQHNYKTSYDYVDQRIVNYVFEVPKQFKQDVDIILDGEYENLSPEVKLKISKFWINYTTDSIVNSVLKTSWFKPEIDNEIFNISSY